MRYRFTKDDIHIKRDKCGNYILSIILDGQLIEKKYIFYPKRKAIQQFQQEYGTYPKDYKPLGIYPLCNFGGLSVMEIKYGINDYVVVCDNYGDGYKNITYNQIYYNKKGGYFIRNGQRWHLNKFMSAM